MESFIRELLVEANTKAKTRVHPIKLPQNPVYPSITYSRVSTQRLVSHDGDSNLIKARLQISLWAARYEDAKELAAEVTQLLQCLKADPIQVIFMTNEIDLYDDKVKVYQIAQDYEVNFKEE
jgi:hypothetical protein